jgi:CheY-like chemotaxis protein
LQPRVVDLNQLMFGMDEVLRGLVGERIEISMRPAADLHCVKVDPSQVEQVIINLALNARDAMPQGGLLTLETYNAELTADCGRALGDLPAGSYAVLSVLDNGVGMTDEIKRHLFEPFYTTKEVGKASGLGLATCYGTVKQSGGTITVESQVGVGTEVRVHLPCASADEIEPADEPKRPAARAVSTDLPHGTETVLLVEDESAVREMSAAVLRDLGYQVIEAGDGREAIQVMDRRGSEPVDLLLTDIVMPRVGGRELAAELTGRFPETKVLFTSGYSDLSTEGGGQLDERVQFLQKPFTSSGLGREVRRVLDGQPVTGGI